MRILVLATKYPRPDGYVTEFFVHSRNRWYMKEGIDVSVVSFAATNDYILDGIKVYTENSYKTKLKTESFDVLVSHAPNLRNHFGFLRKNSDRFDRMVFFFHGHEVLRTSEVYPPPYDYTRKDSLLYRIARDMYDRLKVQIWRKYFSNIAYKSHFVFVSSWMYNMFRKYVKLEPVIIERRGHIISNCVGEVFEHESYNREAEKKYDFLTIRNRLDVSKYCIDLVTRLANAYPQYRFCVVGKGDFYRFNRKPGNLVWFDRHLSHSEIVNLLNEAKCALMPTRADAQGVLACEMATFGIPLITSNIDVCREIFEGFDNVAYISNDRPEMELESVFESRRVANQKHTRYFAENTIQKEIELFEGLKGSQ